MTPDDRTAQLLLTDKLLANMRPDPVLAEATPAPWATTNHEGAEL
jgi:hypothetical protein